MCGVAIDSLKDMEILFDGIPLDKVTTSMTINGPAAMIFAMYLAVAEKQGAPFHKVGGTIQNDILKEYIAQHSWIFPPSRRCGSSPTSSPTAQTTSRDGTRSASAGTTSGKRGPRRSRSWPSRSPTGSPTSRRGSTRGSRGQVRPTAVVFLQRPHGFLRGDREVPCRAPDVGAHHAERFHAKDENSWKLRFHTQTAGCTLTAQQPMNNVVRVALQALSGVLGGTQSLHTNSMDETMALPTEQAVTVALRTQQIIAEESALPTRSTLWADRSSWNS